MELSEMEQQMEQLKKAMNEICATLGVGYYDLLNICRYMAKSLEHLDIAADNDNNRRVRRYHAEAFADNAFDLITVVETLNPNVVSNVIGLLKVTEKQES